MDLSSKPATSAVVNYSPPPHLISLAEGGRLVGLHSKSLRRWITEGRLVGYRVGPRAVRIDRDELLALATPLASA